MNQLEKYLNTYFTIQEDKLSSVAAHFERVVLKRGELILRTGQYCKKMFFIESGILRVSTLNDGKDITQWIATEGQFGTDLNSFMLNQPARWNIEAITDATLYFISKSDYDTIGTVIPNWPELEKIFLVNCFTTMENRIFQFLSLNSEERYLRFFHNNKRLFNQVPLKYLASMLGMTAETFSRIRKKNS